ncbi:MAG: phosphoenolpyruvate synthase [Deltaproteobacteria bacterium]|nr:phosphoenolpyruvate synthase [Deltaproteobacteria bacterium]
MASEPLILWFDDERATQVASVGGKNASLSEMTRTLTGAGVRVPPGFAVTAAAYRTFLSHNALEAPIAAALAALAAGGATLQQTGAAIRRRVASGEIPPAIKAALLEAYSKLSRQCGEEHASVAVRSSATAEDLPEASFAGQQETFLNVRGDVEVVNAWRACVASLFTDRAIAYRDEHGFAHDKVALSVGVQKLVRSDLACAGVAFTLDTETGFPDVVMVTGSWGLGENVVKGTVSPDEVLLFKRALDDPKKRPILRARVGDKERTMVLAQGGSATTRNVDTPLEKRRRLCLSDDDAIAIGRFAVQIERHMSERAGRPMPMDIEWAKDGVSGELYIVQARPETVQSRAGAVGLVNWRLDGQGEVLVKGRAVGSAIAAAPACVIRSVADLERFRPGSILIAESTDPDWVPAMRVAAGIVTEHGGRTCHAAIVSRALGIPAVVGAPDATRVIADGAPVTLSCAGGDEGVVYRGALPFTREETALDTVPKTATRIMINLADPASALKYWRLPTDGVGLLRMEFVVTDDIRVHPMALAHPERVSGDKDRALIAELTRGYADKGEYFVERLARGISLIAASQYPRPVIVRMSDFKTNEYRNLIGGAAFEPDEENPMIGFRGASRYSSPRYQDGFLLECRAIRRAREQIGADNLIVMIPFCRTTDEADRVLAVMKAAGLERGKFGLKVYVMCEIPSNVILAEEFAERFDGFSIGSNDLTQLILGVDRDSELLADLFDERNPAVTRMIRDVIARVHKVGRPIGICGQGPSDHPDFAELLVEAGIDSLSLNPDSFLKVKTRIAALEARRAKA